MGRPVIETVVATLPESESVLSETIETLQRLHTYVRDAAKVDFVSEFHSIGEIDSRYQTIFYDLLGPLAEVAGTFDLRWLDTFHILLRATDASIFHDLRIAGLFGPFESEFSAAFRRISSESEPIGVPDAIFLSVRGMRLAQAGWWGANIGKYPGAVSVERTGYMESLFHEGLHALGVGEGYDKTTHKPIPRCENCWMQYDSTLGSGLCEGHLEELRNHLRTLGFD